MWVFRTLEYSLPTSIIHPSIHPFKIADPGGFLGDLAQTGRPRGRGMLFDDDDDDDGDGE